MTNPNAAVAGTTSAAGVFVVWLLGNVFHVELSAELGATIAGVASAVVLFVGREGLAGIWNTVMHGTKKPPASPTTLQPPPPPAPGP